MIYGDQAYPQFSDWSAEDKRNAMAHLKAMESFEFVYCLVALQRTLLYFREPAVQLQSHSSDIASAVALVTQKLKEVQSLRSSEGQLASYSGRVFQHASRIAEQSNIKISTPRIGQRQQHQLNLPIYSPRLLFWCHSWIISYLRWRLGTSPMCRRQVYCKASCLEAYLGRRPVCW